MAAKTKRVRLRPRVEEEIEQVSRKPSDKEKLEDQRDELLDRLSEHIRPERLEYIKVSDAAAKYENWAEDEIDVTLITRQSELRVIMDWEQARKLAHWLLKVTEQGEEAEEEVIGKGSGRAVSKR